MKKRFVLGVVVLSLTLSFTSVFAGECPDGKFPVLMTTPSGNQKTICVSENAVQGIERAAENSESILIPSSCPCYNDDDIQKVMDTYSNLVCIWQKPPTTECKLGDEIAYKSLNCYTGYSIDKYLNCLSTSSPDKCPLDEYDIFLAFQVAEVGICGEKPDSQPEQVCRNGVEGTEYSISYEVETACVERMNKYTK